VTLELLKLLRSQQHCFVAIPEFLLVPAQKPWQVLVIDQKHSPFLVEVDGCWPDVTMVEPVRVQVRQHVNHLLDEDPQVDFVVGE
jgi:hypothetical protein